MKIVINIPEEVYNEAKASGLPCMYDELVASAVGEGTPLPKGHGRLIDADELLDANIDTFSQQTELKIKFAPTIIEADGIEVWNGIHAQITAPKGTFEKIWNDCKGEEDADTN